MINSTTKYAMARFLLFPLLFALAVPTSARPHKEKQPVPCSDLWTAVRETLAKASDYTVEALDNEDMRANFIVVGARYPQTNLVHLKPRNSGCDLQLRIGFTGIDDEWAFRNRVSRALKKLNAGKAVAHREPGPAQ